MLILRLKKKCIVVHHFLYSIEKELDAKTGGRGMTEELDFLEKLAARYMRFTLKRSYKSIARKLGVYPCTVRRYLKPIERKMEERE